MVMFQAVQDCVSKGSAGREGRDQHLLEHQDPIVQFDFIADALHTRFHPLVQCNQLFYLQAWSVIN